MTRPSIVRLAAVLPLPQAFLPAFLGASLGALGCVFDPSGAAMDSETDADTGTAPSTTEAQEASNGDATSTTGASTTAQTTLEPVTGTTTLDLGTTGDPDTTSTTTSIERNTEDGDTSTTSGIPESESDSSESEDSGPIGTGYPGLLWSRYEGSWDALPDFASLTPSATGETPNLNVYVGGGGDHFSLVFEGAIQIPEDGTYTFYLRSDDGSRLFLRGREVIDLDGLHDTTEVGIYRNNFTAGFVTLRVEYFEATASEALTLTWEGPNFGETTVPDDVLFHFEAPEDTDDGTSSSEGSSDTDGSSGSDGTD